MTATAAVLDSSAMSTTDPKTIVHYLDTSKISAFMSDLVTGKAKMTPLAEMILTEVVPSSSNVSLRCASDAGPVVAEKVDGAIPPEVPMVSGGILSTASQQDSYMEEEFRSAVARDVRGKREVDLDNELISILEWDCGAKGPMPMSMIARGFELVSHLLDADHKWGRVTRNFIYHWRGLPLVYVSCRRDPKSALPKSVEFHNVFAAVFYAYQAHVVHNMHVVITEPVHNVLMTANNAEVWFWSRNHKHMHQKAVNWRGSSTSAAALKIIRIHWAGFSCCWIPNR